MRSKLVIQIAAYTIAVIVGGVATASAQTYSYAAYCPFNKTIAGIESALDVGATRGNCAGVPNGAFSIIGNTGNPTAFCYSTARITPNAVCAYVSGEYNRICPDNERYSNSAKTAAQCAAAGGTLSSLAHPDPYMKICRMPATRNDLVCAYYDYFIPLSACTNGLIDRAATIAACRALPDTFFGQEKCRMERPVPPTAICRYLPQTITCPSFPLGMMEVVPDISNTRCRNQGGTPSGTNGPPPAASCSIRGNQNILMLCAYRPVIRPITPPPTPPAMPRPTISAQPMPTFPITPYNTPNICMKKIVSGTQIQTLDIARTQTNCISAPANGTFTQDTASIQCVADRQPIPNLCVYNRYVLSCAANMFGTTASQFATFCDNAGGTPDTSLPVWTCSSATGNLPMSICGF